MSTFSRLCMVVTLLTVIISQDRRGTHHLPRTSPIREEPRPIQAEDHRWSSSLAAVLRAPCSTSSLSLWTRVSQLTRFWFHAIHPKGEPTNIFLTQYLHFSSVCLLPTPYVHTRNSGRWSVPVRSETIIPGTAIHRRPAA